MLALQAVDAVPSSLVAQLEEMASSGSTDRERRIGAILLNLISQGVFTFKAEDIMKKYNLVDSTCISMLRTAINLSLICKAPKRDWSGQFTYSFSQQMPGDIRCDGLTRNQKQILTSLFTVFKTREFMAFDGSKVCNLHQSTFSFHMANFVERGIINVERSLGKPNTYTFHVTPQKYPQCFLSEKAEEHHNSSSGVTMSPMPMSAAAG